MLQQSKAWMIFVLGAAMLSVSLIPACGGGSSGGASASPQGGAPAASTVTFSNALSGMTATQVQAAIDELDARLDALTGSTTKVHQSTQSGVTVIPANTSQFVVRSITFTPTNPSDRILSITAEGTYDISNGGTSPTDLQLSVLDGSGKVISDEGTPGASNQSSVWRLDVVGTGLSYRLFSRMTSRKMSALEDQSGAYPSTSYTIRVLASSLPNFVGQINTLRFSIETSEGVTIIPASPNIGG
jgi:hypothetical protein